MSGVVLMAPEPEMCGLPPQQLVKPEKATAVSVAEVYDEEEEVVEVDDCESSCGSEGCDCRDFQVERSDLSFEDFKESSFTKSYRKTTLESSYSASVKFAKMIELLANMSVEAFSLKDFYEKVSIQQEEYKRMVRHFRACYHRERHAHANARKQIVALEGSIIILKETHKEEIIKIRETYEKTIKEIRETYEKTIREIREKHEKELILIKESHKVEITKTREHFERTIREIREKYEKEINKTREHYERVIKETKEKHEKEIIKTREHYERIIKETREKHEKELIMIRETHSQELIMIKESHSEKITEVREIHEKEIIMIKEKHETFIKELKEKFEKELIMIKESHSQEIVKIKETHESSIIVIKEKHNTIIKELKETHEKYVREVRETHETLIKELKETHTKEIEKTVIETRGNLAGDFDCEREELKKLWQSAKKAKTETETHYRKEIEELNELHSKSETHYRAEISELTELHSKSEKHYRQEINQLNDLQSKSEKHYRAEIEELNVLHSKEVSDLEERLMSAHSSGSHHCSHGHQSSTTGTSTTTTTTSTSTAKSESVSESSSTSISVSEHKSMLEQIERDNRTIIQNTIAESQKEKETLVVKVKQLEKDLAAAKSRAETLLAASPKKPTHGIGKGFAIQWIMYHNQLIDESVNINNTSYINIHFARDPPFKVNGNLWDSVAMHAAPGCKGYHVDNKTLGCDPAPKKTKTMVVAYTMGESNKLYYAAAVEGDMLKLPGSK